MKKVQLWCCENFNGTQKYWAHVNVSKKSWSIPLSARAVSISQGRAFQRVHKAERRCTGNEIMSMQNTENIRLTINVHNGILISLLCLFINNRSDCDTNNLLFALCLHRNSFLFPITDAAREQIQFRARHAWRSKTSKFSFEKVKYLWHVSEGDSRMHFNSQAENLTFWDHKSDVRVKPGNFFSKFSEDSATKAGSGFLLR